MNSQEKCHVAFNEERGDHQAASNHTPDLVKGQDRPKKSRTNQRKTKKTRGRQTEGRGRRERRRKKRHFEGAGRATLGYIRTAKSGKHAEEFTETQIRCW